LLQISFHSIKTKLVLLLVVLLGLYMLAALYLLSALSSTVDRMSDRLFEKGSGITELVLNADRDLYQALTGYLSAAVVYSDPASREAAVADYTENLQQSRDLISAAKALIEEGGLQDLQNPESGKTLRELADEVENGLASWAALTAEVLRDPLSFYSKQIEIDVVFNTTRGSIDQIEDVMKDYQQEAIREERGSAARIAEIMYYSLAVEWVLLIAAGILLVRQISRSVDRIRQKTRRVSEGYLELPETTRYPKDELGQIQKDVDNMTVRIRQLVEEIQIGAQAVSTATHELAAAADDSSKASSHVAANIQEVTGLVETQATITSETSRAIGEMAAGVQRIAESAGTIAANAEAMNTQAQKGYEFIISLKEQMDVTVEAISRLDGIIATLNQKSSEIDAIAGNIKEFAQQTNILSLNASIEAARAGEGGRGFAVVADEIRKLAAHSMESAGGIDALISDTQGEIMSAGEQMRTTIEQVERSSALLQQVADGFRKMADMVRQIYGQIHEASSVTQQMSASSEEVSASMEQAADSIREVSAKAENVSAATEEQLALAENIASSAEQLRSVVANLNKAVGYFKI